MNIIKMTETLYNFQFQLAELKRERMEIENKITALRDASE